MTSKRLILLLFSFFDKLSNISNEFFFVQTFNLSVLNCIYNNIHKMIYNTMLMIRITLAFLVNTLNGRIEKGEQTTVTKHNSLD